MLVGRLEFSQNRGPLQAMGYHPIAARNASTDMTGTPYWRAFCAFPDALSGSAATRRSHDFFVTLLTG
jgi:hypothetical protein